MNSRDLDEAKSYYFFKITLLSFKRNIQFVISVHVKTEFNFVPGLRF